MRPCACIEAFRAIIYIKNEGNLRKKVIEEKPTRHTSRAIEGIGQLQGAVAAIKATL